MKKQILTLILVAFSVGITLNSCKKKGCTDKLATNYDENAKKDDDSCIFPVEEDKDTIQPIITINEPSADMYMHVNGEGTVPISVDVSDNDGLHSVIVVLMNMSADEEVIRIHLHPDTKTSTIDTSYTTTAIHQDFALSVTAEDYSENISTAEAYTHVMN